MEQSYLNIVRRWLWLLLLLPLLTGMTAYFIKQQQPLRYQASSRMIVGPGIDSLNPDLNDLRAGGQLMRSYAELATTRSVLQDVIDQADLQLEPDKLEKKVRISVDQEAQILTIQVEDSDPVRAATIANSLAEVLLRLSPSGGESPAAVLNAQMLNQASELEATIPEIEGRIGQLERELSGAITAEIQKAVQEQLGQERARLAEARSTLAVLYDSLRNTPTNQVKIIETATNGNQVARQLSLVAITAGLAGMVVAVVVAFGFEYLDKTLRTAEDLDSLDLVPVLGTVSVDDIVEGSSPAKQFSTLQLRMQSSEAEDFRMLGTKLPVTGDTSGLNSLVISSVDENGDTGEIAASLAVVLAQSGKRVTLIDANLHEPTIGKLLGISTNLGLTHLLSGRSKELELMEIQWAPGFTVLPSGPVTNDAFSELASTKMTALLHQLQGQVDVILIALPPLLSYAESLLLASRTDGAILLVHSGKSKHDTVELAIANLETIGARTVGAIMVMQSDQPPLQRLKNTFRRFFRISGKSEESRRSSARPDSRILPSFLNRTRD